MRWYGTSVVGRLRLEQISGAMNGFPLSYIFFQSWSILFYCIVHDFNSGIRVMSLTIFLYVISFCLFHGSVEYQMWFFALLASNNTTKTGFLFLFFSLLLSIFFYDNYNILLNWEFGFIFMSCPYTKYNGYTKMLTYVQGIKHACTNCACSIHVLIVCIYGFRIKV